jgi:hypothetical protein
LTEPEGPNNLPGLRSFRHTSGPFLIACVCLLAACGFVREARAELEIVRLWTGYKETSAFVRLREFLTGREVTGGSTILRTDPAVRDGFYYTLRLADSDRGAVPGGLVILHVVPPDGTRATEYRFPFAPSDRRQVRLEIGLTGEAWTHGNTLPLAWHLEVRDEAGRALVSRESFLWSENTDKAPPG